MHYGYGYFEEAQLGRVRDLRLWRRLLDILRPYWSPILCAILLSLLISVTGLTLPYIVRLGVDGYITREALSLAERLRGLRHLALAFTMFMAVGFAANFFQVVLLEWAGQRVMHALRQRLFSPRDPSGCCLLQQTPRGQTGHTPYQRHSKHARSHDVRRGHRL